VASQPSLIKEDETSASMGEGYVSGWAATTKLMAAGKSWSGNERNCVQLNCGDGTFVDISAATCLDFLDDGRAVVSTDWDGDGDLDLWLKNRTGPQLRFIRNDASGEQSFVAIKLEDPNGNRDAIGARVTVVANNKPYSRVLFAGDGYLSQSSKRLVIGLDRAKEIDEVIVTWPDGQADSFSGIKINQAYRLKRDAEAISLPARLPPTIPVQAPEERAGPAARLVLKVPLPLAPSLLKALEIPPSSGPTLVSLWAHWCKPCHAELRGFLRRSNDFEKAGLQLVPLNVDGPKHQSEAEAAWEEITADVSADVALQMATDKTSAAVGVLLEHVREQRVNALPLPLNLLISPDGQLQIIYLGVVDTNEILQDAGIYGRNSVKASQRYQFEGRWYFRVPRDFAGLAELLRAAKLDEAASFYERSKTGR